VCDVFVGIPLPPGLQVGNTQTGFHPFIESSALREETPVASNGIWATDSAENKTPTYNPAKTLCTIFIVVVSESRREILKRSRWQQRTLFAVSPCRYQKYITDVFS
jgi:hypothetical protein